MFRVKESEELGASSVPERVLLATLLLSLVASLGSVYLIYGEYKRLGTWSSDGEVVSHADVDFLKSDVRLQFVASLVVSSILMFCLATIWWLRRRYLSSQRLLRTVKMLAHDILASMDDGVVTTDCGGIVTSINSASLRLLNLDFECVGRPLESISPSIAPLVAVHRKVIQEGSAVRDRDFSINRPAHALRLHVDGHALKDPSGTTLGCVIHLRDVTERALLEERMRRMERFLGLAALASGLHHEIKNPLTALSIHIQLLEENLSERQSSESVNELVGVLKTEVGRLNGVLESFRSFANLQNLSIQPTDALAVLEEAIRLIHPQATEQGVQITLLHPEIELPLVSLDAEKFTQVILNLLINALEAMPKGGALAIAASVVASELRISIKDSGPGIATEARKNLFQPYFSTKTKGSGLGLALSEKLVNQHGGHIDYQTGPEGTTFEVAVPVEQRNEAA
jgi:signal transduction histidine kinase